jgi:hypothetical protein
LILLTLNMNIKRHTPITLEFIIEIVLVILLFLCLLEMPYGYYQLIRFFGRIHPTK